MNIFVLDLDFEKNAQYHVDKWIVKMPLETAQLLCTARIFLGDSAPYKATHVNHGCSKWIRNSLENYLWAANLGMALCKEYTYRYGKIHKCQSIIDDCIKNLPKIASVGLTPHYLAMPDKYKNNNVVESYRKYAMGEKQYLSKWTKREKPEWWAINE